MGKKITLEEFLIREGVYLEFMEALNNPGPNSDRMDSLEARQRAYKNESLTIDDAFAWEDAPGDVEWSSLESQASREGVYD